MTMPGTIDLTERSTARRVWLVAAGWTAIALIMAFILRLQNELPLVYGLPSTLFNYYVLGALVWVACRIDARLELWKQPQLKALGAHVGLGVVLLALHFLILIGFHRIRVGAAYWQLVFAGTWMY